MIVLFCMFQVVLHRPAIDAPVAWRSLLVALGHQVPLFLNVHEDHLEPKLSPAIVAYCCSLVQPHPLLHSRRRPKQSTVEHELELAALCQFQHLMEHVAHFLLLADQQVAEGVHLHLVIAEVDRFYGACGCSITKQD